ncbi:hypothetical protein PAAG_04567 [Paracoccidioides lutzii Pb01]|uniref:Uncharacterized protein n=1 Tax=Paracoccidioides lutzii (strain ATCC MYA-826 / Pb01) TaxID=502779 RepID=C1H1C3_PARBA|nr:hypothetical protein PAAG_04567 [Paracoccidioides lutzii Pb01]EEH33517.2 hypothetical protein PAAG_04567 [Paracoccidioides lutzii Pb01]
MYHSCNSCTDKSSPSSCLRRSVPPTSALSKTGEKAKKAGTTRNDQVWRPEWTWDSPKLKHTHLRVQFCFEQHRETQVDVRTVTPITRGITDPFYENTGQGTSASAEETDPYPSEIGAAALGKAQARYGLCQLRRFVASSGSMPWKYHT